jgi:transposase
VIDKWLEQDLVEPRKQRHTMTRIYRRLQKEHSYTGSYPTVKRYVVRKRDLMNRSKEGFLPLAHPKGHAQVDFGKFKYYDGADQSSHGYALTLSFPNSNTGWTQVFQSENQECLLAGLKRIFYHIKGVPVRIRCDNMTTAVTQILKGTERIITDGFYRFMLHHRFGADFCNPDSGNEKGNCENKVGYTRRNMLVPVPTILDFDMFNTELLQLCDEDHNREHYLHGELISELWEEERDHLLALPEYEYEVFRYDSLSINKYGCITVDKAKYSISPDFIGRVVQVKIFFDKIEVYYDHRLLKTLKRDYGKKGESFDWRDYLSVLVKKPGAVPHTRFFDQMPKLWKEHLLSASSRERKTALSVLMEIVKDGNEPLCDDALELAYTSGRVDADSIRQCYYLIAKPESYPRPLILSKDTPLINYRPNLEIYDSLTGGAK